MHRSVRSVAISVAVSQFYVRTTAVVGTVVVQYLAGFAQRTRRKTKIDNFKMKTSKLKHLFLPPILVYTSRYHFAAVLAPCSWASGQAGRLQGSRQAAYFKQYVIVSRFLKKTYRK